MENNLSSDTPFSNDELEPLTALSLLVDDVHKDCGRVLSAKPEVLLLPFLKAINQLPIDIEPVNITSEKEVYAEIVLTQTLKEGLHALIHENEEKLNVINASLKTDAYKDYLEKKVTIPDFYKVLLLCANIMSWYNNEDSTTLLLSPHSKMHNVLFEQGLSLNTPGWTLTQVDSLNYKLTFSDLSAKYPAEISTRILIAIPKISDALQSDISFTRVLFDTYDLMPTEKGLVDTKTLNNDTTLDDEFNVSIVTSEDIYVYDYGEDLFNVELVHMFAELLENDAFLGINLEIIDDVALGLRDIYGSTEDETCDYFVIRFTHPFYPAEECHVVFGETVFVPDVPIKVLRRPITEISDTSDLVITEGDDYEQAELSLLEALHFMLSVKGLPVVNFVT